MNNNEIVLLKCIAKSCRNKVNVKLKTTDISNASEQFFILCKKHKEQFNNKIKQDYNKKEVEKELINITAKEFIKNNTIKQKGEDKK